MQVKLKCQIRIKSKKHLQTNYINLDTLVKLFFRCVPYYRKRVSTKTHYWLLRGLHKHALK